MAIPYAGDLDAATWDRVCAQTWGKWVLARERRLLIVQEPSLALTFTLDFIIKLVQDRLAG